MKPLAGKKILVTREESQAKAFSRQIALAGGIPIELPLLEIHCTHRIEDKPIWKRLGSSYSWILFTSAYGVNCFFNQLEVLGLTQAQLASAKIAVVGHKTEDSLKQYGLHAHFIPSCYDAETMAMEFLRKNPRPGTLLLVRGNLSRDVLPQTFARENIAFDELEVYETVYNKEAGSKLPDVLKANEFDFYTFTSPSSVEAFFEVGGSIESETAVCCIGTTTSKRAEQLGISNIIIPEQYTIEGMIQVMEHAAAGRN